MYFEAIDTKFELLNQYTAVQFSDYSKGKWGIANKMDHQYYYGTSKTGFIFKELMKALASGRLPEKGVVCETGYNAGHSAMLFLDALPGYKFYEFDAGDIPWSVPNAMMFNQMYGDRFEYIQGDGGQTIRQFITERPSIKCDVMFLDGRKGEGWRYDDILLFGKLKKSNTLVFGDEANTPECMSGQVSRDHPRCAQVHDGTEYAWNKAAQEGLLLFDACSEPQRINDVVCLWHYP